MKIIPSLLMILVISPFNSWADTWFLKAESDSMYTHSVSVDSWNSGSQIPNPLYNCVKLNPNGQCSYSIGYRSKHSSGGEMGSSTVERAGFASNAKTMGELAENIAKYHPSWLNREFKLYANGNVRYCFFVAYMINGGSHIQMPGEQCIYSELPETTCWIQESAILLTHIVNTENVSGSMASDTLHIFCSDKMKVRVIGKNNLDAITLHSPSNFKSVITLNNAPISSGTIVNANDQGTAIEVKSTLVGTPPEGEYQGSTVIIVAPE